MKKHKPRKRFGQNFLQDKAVIDRLISILSVKSSDHFVEIGPGLGALTKSLPSNLNKLDLVEIDRDVIPELEKICHQKDDCKIYCADVLKFDFSQLITSPEKLRFVGNLPYNISTPIIFHVLQYAKHIHDMHFMLQKELVDRICAEVGASNYGRLSVMVQYYCQAESLFIIEPNAFWPQPKVDSAYIRLIPHSKLPVVAEDEELFAKVVTLAFNQRRKTISNSLKSVINAQSLEKINIDPKSRAQQLTIKNFASIANLLYNNVA